MKVHAVASAAAIALTASLIAGCEPDTVWSPDSKMLALDPHGIIVTYDLAAKRFQQRTFGPSKSINPTWTPDGKSLLYYTATVKKDGEVQTLKLTSLNLSTAKATDLPTAVPAPKVVNDPNEFRIDLGGRMDVAREVLTATYSADGKKLAYVAFNGTKTEIFIADASGAGSRRIAALGTSPFRPVWSPDGQHLAYFTESADETKKPDAEPPAEGELRATRKFHRLEVAGADGSGAKVIWDESRSDVLSALGPRPEWSKDSRSLLVATDNPPPIEQQAALQGGPSETGKLWSVPLEGEPKLLGTLPGPTIFATFSSGRVAFFKAPKDKNEQNPHLMFMAPPYDAPRELLEIQKSLVGIKAGQEPEVDGFPVPALSPDGKTISMVYAPKTGTTKLLLFSTNGDKPTALDVPLKLQVAVSKPKVPAKAKRPAAKSAPSRRK